MKRIAALCFGCVLALQLIVGVQSFHHYLTPLLSRRNTLLDKKQKYLQSAQQYFFQNSRHATPIIQSKMDGAEEQETVVVQPGGEEDVFSKEQWSEIEEAQPSELSVMKDLLGVNVFTYVLAFLIIVFTGLNLTLGPGWLGGTLGIEGTGSIEEVSPNLPNTVDLNREEYLL